MKKFFIIILFSLLFTVGVDSVSANTSSGDISTKVLSGMKNTGSAAGFTTKTNLAQSVGSIINGFLIMFGVVFTILIIYAGYLWMTAYGDEGKVAKSKDLMKSAAIGLIIILAAYSISYFVINAITKAV